MHTSHFNRPNWMLLYRKGVLANKTVETTVIDIEKMVTQRLHILDFLVATRNDAGENITKCMARVVHALRERAETMKWTLFGTLADKCIMWRSRRCECCDTASFMALYTAQQCAPNRFPVWFKDWWHAAEKLLFVVRARSLSNISLFGMLLALCSSVGVRIAPPLVKQPDNLHLLTQHMLQTNSNVEVDQNMVLLPWKAVPTKLVASRRVCISSGMVLVDNDIISPVLSHLWEKYMTAKESAIANVTTHDPSGVLDAVFASVKSFNIPNTDTMVKAGWCISKPGDHFACQPFYSNRRMLTPSSGRPEHFMSPWTAKHITTTQLDCTTFSALVKGWMPLPKCVQTNIDLCADGNNKLKHFGRRAFVLWCKKIGLTQEDCMALLRYGGRHTSEHEQRATLSRLISDIKRWFEKETELSCKAQYNTHNSLHQGSCPYKYDGGMVVGDCKTACVRDTLQLADIETCYRLPSHPSDFLCLKRSYFVEPASSDDE